MALYNVHEGQNLIDIACELYGTAEMVVKLAMDNSLSLDDTTISLNTALAGRMNLVYDETLVAQVETATMFILNKQNIVSPDLNPDLMLIEHSESEHNFTEYN